MPSSRSSSKDQKISPTEIMYQTYMEACMSRESQAFPTYAILSIHTIVMTYYASDPQIEKVWNEYVVKPFNNSTSEEEIKQIRNIACNFFFILLNNPGLSSVDEILSKMLNLQPKHLFYLNEEALVSESSFLLNTLSRFANPNDFPVLNVLEVLKEVQVRTHTLLVAIKETSLYEKLRKDLGLDEQKVMEPCSAKYYRDCVYELKERLMKVLQYIRMNINIPR